MDYSVSAPNVTQREFDPARSLLVSYRLAAPTTPARTTAFPLCRSGINDGNGIHMEVIFCYRASIDSQLRRATVVEVSCWKTLMSAMVVRSVMRRAQLCAIFVLHPCRAPNDTLS